MMKQAVLFCILFFVLFAAKSQDLIYLTNGTKVKGQVVEINVNDVKYKNGNNLTGPTYVITKNDVLMVEYKNGEVEILNKNPKSVSPQPVETSPVKKEKKESDENDLYYANKNTLMINGLGLANADVTLMYQRDFAQNHLAALIMGSYNFNLNTSWTNLFIKGLANSKKNYDVGLGCNYFPSVKRKSQYFVGLLVKYLNYSYDKTTYETVDIGGYPYQVGTIKRAQSSQVSVLIVNGVQFRITPNVNFQMFAGIGGASADADLKDVIYSGGSGSSSGSKSSGAAFAPKMYLGLCFGYRF